jgi:hypothetical protein
MSNYEKLKKMGLAQGLLSHEDIYAVMQNEIMSPPELAKVKEKLKGEGILVYKGVQSKRWEKLIEKGKSKGFLQRVEVISSMPHEVDDEEIISDILDMIKDMGIKIES